MSGLLNISNNAYTKMQFQGRCVIVLLANDSNSSALNNIIL